MLTHKPDPPAPSNPTELKFLRPDVIAIIEDALTKVGPFGEVHLIIERGHLRFIRTIKSESVDHTKSGLTP